MRKSKIIPLIGLGLILQPFRLDSPKGPSMHPTLSLSGDVLICGPISSRVEVGDIVAFRSPFDHNKRVMKRVVALGGDSVSYSEFQRDYVPFSLQRRSKESSKSHSENVKGVVMNQPQNEEREREREEGENQQQQQGQEQEQEEDQHKTKMKSEIEKAIKNKSEKHFIPKGHVWMEGDNDPHSIDSRHYGPVPVNMIECRAVYRIWPPHLIGPLPRSPSPSPSPSPSN